ncbi:hypothetical protein Taro_043514 [Colocasia esculenta]|uniref:Uncharacterized protein n=1 Tax=Colocasia esculenta TaxID=4460 RepID=A0A843WLB9_COLES|nr:hypothetical protein [Colocasia esculenta]
MMRGLSYLDGSHVGFRGVRHIPFLLPAILRRWSTHTFQDQCMHGESSRGGTRSQDPRISLELEPSGSLLPILI